MSTEAVMLTKDELEDREEAWQHVAETEGYRCAVCNQTPPYGEREVYFETGMCSWDAHTAQKD